MNYQDAETCGLIKALASVFTDREPALGVLSAIDFPVDQIPAFNRFDNPKAYWSHVCRELDHGVVVDGFRKLVSVVARMYPGNAIFPHCLTPHGPPVSPPAPAPASVPPRTEPAAPNTSTTRAIVVTLPADLSDADALAAIAALRQIGRERGIAVRVDLATQGSTRYSLSLEGTAEEQQAYLEASRQYLAERGISATVTAPPHQHRDYFLDPIYIQGPDGARYEVDQVRASTRVSEFARSFVSSYDADFWPADKAGQRPAVVDRLDPNTGGRQRLRGDQTLHESGVRPRDTLAVLPEATAGIVNPLLNAEALAQVRNQIQEFMTANSWFQVTANSPEIPTEYEFAFPARSFAGPGVPLEHHRVFIQFPREFPLEAPVVYWQTAIFHPNIESQFGLVCLGALAESYRSGLHFGVVCQMLVDMAGYRNYVVHECYNLDAAQWAASDAGQAAIRAIGGVTLADMQSPGATPHLRLRRVDGGR